MGKIFRQYSDLIQIPGFRERYEYLKLGGSVGETSFGFDRYLNQMLYRSREWRSVRDKVIIRDNGFDLGVDGYPLGELIIVHHMNPLTVEDVEDHNPDIFDLRYLISVSPETHNAIHFGDASILPQLPTERHPWDTCPWRG
jgi:hypothetical protein